MPVTNVTTDPDTRSLTITAEFAAPPERVWEIYADPRQVEKIFGPPGYPATFVDHDLSVGGKVTYYMTSPEGDRYGGWWTVTEVDAPRRLAYDDGFADADLNPLPDMPVSHVVMTFEPSDTGTLWTSVTSYDTAEDLEKVLEMGVEEGATSAINQIDDLLAA